MKNLILIILLFLSFTLKAQTFDWRGLPAGSTPTGTEVMPATQNGRAVKLTVNQISGLATFTLTTTGTSGAATYSGGILNIPNYAGTTYTADNSTLQLIGSQFSIKSLGVTNGLIANSTIDLTTKVTGTLPVANGGTGITSLGSGMATWWSTPSSANLRSALTDELGNGADLFDNSTGAIFTTPVINGLPTGTGVASAATASTLVARDVNSNTIANNLLNGYTTTATAAGTTTLTVSSTYYQYFTGSTTQTATLPVTSTLTLGQGFYFQNNSTGVVTVQSSGANVLQAMAANSILIVQCISLSGTGTASWNWNYFPANPTTTIGDIIYVSSVSGGYGVFSRRAIGSDGQVLTVSGGVPTWAASGGLSGLTTNGVLVAGSSTTATTPSDLNYTSRGLLVGLSSSGSNTVYFSSLTSGSNITVSTSTGEFALKPIASHYLTFYSNGNNKRFNINTSGNITSGSTESPVFRTTNGGSDVNAHFMIDPASSLSSGKGYGFETTNGLVFTQGNATRRIAYAMIQGASLTSTAGSEAGGLAILAQSGGTAAAQVATFLASGVSIKGTNTNDNASAGYVGEDINSKVAVGSAVSLTTATAANITSISLTAGDWEVEGNINFSETTATVSARTAGLSSTSATLPTDGTEVENGAQSTATSEKNSCVLPKKRFPLSSTTTIYLVGSATFSAGTCVGYGYIKATRIR